MSLAERIAQIIRVQGPIPVAQFMRIALHEPAQGYYAQKHPIGTRGDFITAPEISQIFGELLGAWIVQVWRDQGAPAPARLVELGPGSGTLMADVLRMAKVDAEFLSSFDLRLVEASARLQRMQANKLNGVAIPVHWTDRVEEALGIGPVFLLGNEFFDALPIRQFVFTERGWCERMVGFGDRPELAFVVTPVPMPLSIPAARGKPRLGDVYEVCPSGEGIVEQVAAAIAQHGGAALIVDYGYAGNAGFGETLQAVAGHRYAGVLENPGEADLSAHVDFTALTRSAERGGAKVFGPVAQGQLLERLGIQVRARCLAEKNPEQGDEIAAAVARLVSPGDMGTLFNALAILPNGAPTPPGF